jgi:uncharacterized protein YndB with AHSA1/START domain
MTDAVTAPHDLVLERVVPVTPPDEGFLFTAIIEFEPVASGTRVRAIARHASAVDAASHAEMGFEQGWGAALDQLVALFD